MMDQSFLHYMAAARERNQIDLGASAQGLFPRRVREDVTLFGESHVSLVGSPGGGKSSLAAAIIFALVAYWHLAGRQLVLLYLDFKSSCPSIHRLAHDLTPSLGDTDFVHITAEAAPSHRLSPVRLLLRNAANLGQFAVALNHLVGVEGGNDSEFFFKRGVAAIQAAIRANPNIWNFIDLARVLRNLNIEFADGTLDAVDLLAQVPSLNPNPEDPQLDFRNTLADGRSLIVTARLPYLQQVGRVLLDSLYSEVRLWNSARESSKRVVTIVFVDEFHEVCTQSGQPYRSYTALQRDFGGGGSLILGFQTASQLPTPALATYFMSGVVGYTGGLCTTTQRLLRDGTLDDYRAQVDGRRSYHEEPRLRSSDLTWLGSEHNARGKYLLRVPGSRRRLHEYATVPFLTTRERFEHYRASGFFGADELVGAVQNPDALEQLVPTHPPTPPAGDDFFDEIFDHI